MDKRPSTPVGIRILIAGLAVISVIFPVLYMTEMDRNTHQKVSLARQETTIQNLQQQLAALKKINSELANSYIQIQEKQSETESELQELVEHNWENKYETTLSEKNLLSDEYSRTRHQQNIDINRLERANDFLVRENNSLKKSVRTQTVANEQLLQTIEEIEAESRQLKNTIAKLKKPLKTSPSATPDTSVTQLIIKNNQATTDIDKSSAYRHVRLQSLTNTMTNKNSNVRRKILINVIPTIPGGVSGNEFLTLTDNMKSEDILAVLQNTHQYINRPLDNSVMSILAGRMNEADVAAAGPIIFSSGDSGK